MVAINCFIAFYFTIAFLRKTPEAFASIGSFLKYLIIFFIAAFFIWPIRVFVILNESLK